MHAQFVRWTSFLSASLTVAATALILAAGPALAQTTWDGIRKEVYGSRTIHNGLGVVTIEAPYRPDNLSSVPFSVDAKLPGGRTIKSIAFIVDENPSPVAAVFRMHQPREQARVAIKFRLNTQSHVRAVVEANDGELYMAEQLVKFAGGQAACSAPPNGDPAEIAANMGKMHVATLEAPGAARSTIESRVRLDVSHPNHTGMVMDQITLLYVPLRMVSRLEVRQGGDALFDMSGSITLSQDPSIEFDFRRNGADSLDVAVQDTSGTEWKGSFPVGAGS